MKKYKLYLLVGLVIISFYILMQFMGLGWIEHLELVALEFRMKLRGEIEHSDQVKIVAIDNRSLAQLYQEEDNPWPWRRDVYARVIDQLNQAGVQSIVMDVSFDHYNHNDLAGDREFATSLFMANNVTIGAYLINDQQEFNELPSAYQEKLTKRMEHLNFRYQILNPNQYLAPRTFSTFLHVPPEELFINGAWAYGTYEIGLPDANGLYHSMPLVINEEYHSQQQRGSSVFLPNINILGLAAYFDLKPGDYVFDLKNNQILLDEHRSIPVDANGYFNINYYGARAFDEVAVIDVLNKDSSELQEIFADKLVLIGHTAEAKGLVDLRPTPFNKNEAGVQLHATTIQNIIDQNYLKRTSLLTTLGLILFLFLLAAFISKLQILNLSIILNLVLIASFNILNYTLFLNNIWVELFYPNLILFLFLIYSTITKVYLENKERIQTKNFFSRYVPESVVEQILANPEKINLGGKEMEVSILFIDIIGFTGISEDLSASDLVRLLNEFFTEMTEIIKDQHQGTLDKFIGDSILAIFGAPFSKEDDAIRAVDAALAIKKRAKDLEVKWAKRGEKVAFKVGIGISTGQAVIGNIGAPDRMNYTCIGDVVNLGARLESATHTDQYSILISAKTYEQTANQFECEKITDFFVKGKKDPLTVYNVLGRK